MRRVGTWLLGLIRALPCVATALAVLLLRELSSAALPEDNRAEWVLLAEELRQSSNDLRSLARLRAITTDELWSEIGLGESGETDIVADDLTMRNDSRFLIEDPDNHFTAVSEVAGAATVPRITQFDSTIGLQPVATAGT